MSDERRVTTCPHCGKTFTVPAGTGKRRCVWCRKPVAS
jgi:hypothetical protein